MIYDPQPKTLAGSQAPTQAAKAKGEGASVDLGIISLYEAHRWDEACSLLYQIYWSSILAIATRRLRGWRDRGSLAESADDVAIAALHRIHDSLRRMTEGGRIREIVTLRAWIRRIVARQVCDSLSRRSLQTERLSSEGDVEPEATAQDAALCEREVIELMDGNRRLVDLRACVGDVAGRVGDALRLWLKGSTYKEVAKELAYASFSAAQSAVQGAIQKVRRCMGAKGWNQPAMTSGRGADVH